MDFSKALPFAAVFMILIIGSYCLEIKIQETFGTKDDGIINKGNRFSIYCSVPEMRVGMVTAWYKKQSDKLPIVLGFNDFLMDPTAKLKFVAKSVFAGADEGEDPEEGQLIAYILNLREGLGAEYVDSGDYGCAVTSGVPDENTDHSQTKIEYAELVVLDPVESIHLYSVRTEDMSDPEKNHKEYEDGEDVRIDPGDKFYFRCVSRASNPPAEVNIFVGDTDITYKFKKEVTEQYIEAEDIPGSAASHHIAYDVTLTSKNPIMIEREDNKRPFLCNASVPHQKTVSLHILPTMLYLPEVKCQDELAEYEQKLAVIECKVRATPPLQDVRFVYNETTHSGVINNTIKPGQTEGRMYFRVENGKFEDEIIYSLEFTHAPEQSFRKYLFQGGSKLGNVSAEARLILENPGAVGQSGANILKTMSLLTLMSIVAFCLRS